ncbi:MAG: hypothetical protein HXS44_05030 [Theionarchaea archaeon]|nr:hypothetical protein [Theionarchaea archaeon]
MHRRKKMYAGNSLRMAVAILVAILIFAIPSPVHATAYWTVMVYMDGDNNLEQYAVDDLNEMEAVGSTEKVNIVVQFDRHPGYDNTNGDWTNTKRYYVTRDTNGYDSVITSSEITNMGEVNMGDPNELASFVNWAKTNYPADHYLLVLWDHGSGWKGVSQPLRGVCTDETDGDELSIKEVAAALKGVTCSGNCPLDIVGFDACFMGMVEVDYEIMPFAHYRVGSEEYEPGDGWDYIKFLTFLVANPGALPGVVSTRIVETYMNFYGSTGFETQSAVHLNPTSTVVDALDVFALHLAGAFQYQTEIQNARSLTESFSDPDYIDLYHFAQLIRSFVPHRGIQRDALVLMGAINQAVIAEGHGAMNSNAHGMSIYFPSQSTNYLSNYENDAELSEDTFWDEFLNQYYNPNYSLDAVLQAAPGTVKSTEIVTVTMVVTNTAENTIMGVTPSPLTVISTGTAHAVMQTGPLPVSADLVAGDTATFMWTYQAFSGSRGGTLTFSGNAYGTDSVSGDTVFSPLVVSNTVVVPGPSAGAEEPPPDYNQQVQPLANNSIQSAETGLQSLQDLIAAAESEGKDTTPCKILLELVEEYLQRAQENYEKGNYIAANYWALQATATLEEAEKCIENL